MSKELEALKSIKGTVISSHIGDWKIEYRYVSVIESHFGIIEQALNELEDAKHNYKAVKEMYDNAVAHATKIQEELDELKKRNDPATKVYLFHGTNAKMLDDFLVSGTFFTTDLTIAMKYGKTIYAFELNNGSFKYFKLNEEGYFQSLGHIPFSHCIKLEIISK